MYKMLKAGQFGNRFRIWDTEEEFKQAVDEGFDWLVGIRCVGKQHGLPYFHHKTYREAIVIGRELRKVYTCPVKYYEASPDSFITIQGEFVESAHGAMLEYSRARTHMRAALAKERIMVFGPGARLVLKSYLSEASYEDFLALGQIYPECVIEFTAYEIFVGDLPGRNTCVWEVRGY